MGVLDTIGSNLVLLGMGIPFYSARGLTQTLAPIQSIRNNRNNLRRDIGGNLANLTPVQYLKYSSKVSASDQAPPAMDSVFPGTALTVWCVSTLSYATGGSPNRSQVSGSLVLSNGFYSYRPILNMMVTDLSDDFGEWTAGHKWEITL